MERTTRWEAEALRRPVDRPRPGSGSPASPATIDLRNPRRAEPADRPEPPAPPENLVVPLDAWNRMLDQLGNLHEAGRQLAEARERAARAETEAAFLRERLAELRERLADATAPAAEARASDAGPAATSNDARSTAPGLLARTSAAARARYTSWRQHTRP